MAVHAVGAPANATSPRAPTRPFPPPREIAIVRLSALGDVVHILPVANALRRAYPRARIRWLIQPVPHRLIRGHEAVDEFILFRRRCGIAGLRSFAEARRALRGRRFDLVLDVQTAFKAGLLTGLLSAPVKLGYDRGRARELNWLFTTHRIPPRPRRHVQDEYLEFVESLGIDPRPVEWKIPITEAERRQQREFFERLRRPACAVVVGTSRREKNWAPVRYARLIDALEADLGLRCVLVGGPSAVERAAVDRILERTSADLVDALGDDVRRLAWLLDGADLVVSPDTGPLHIARALETPVVGLYGYTNPKRYGPYDAYGELLVDGYAREPGEDYGCDEGYRPGGMDRISVDDVLVKVERALATYPPRAHSR